MGPIVHILHTGHATLLEQVLQKIEQEKGVGQELALLPIVVVMFRLHVRYRLILQLVLLQGGFAKLMTILIHPALIMLTALLQVAEIVVQDLTQTDQEHHVPSRNLDSLSAY